MMETGFLKEDKEKILHNEGKEHLEQTQAQDEKRFPLGPDPFKEEGSLSSRLSVEEDKGEGKKEKERPAGETPEDQGSPSYGEAARGKNKFQGIPVSNGAGFVFLKAAQWDVSQRSLMAELFKKYIKSAVSNHFDSVSDMFVFFKFLGAEAFDRISDFRGHGLWALNDFCHSGANEDEDLLEMQELFQWDKTIREPSSLPNLIMEYNRIKEQAFLEVKGFKLLLEDKSELTMDTSMVSFGGGGIIPSFSCSSLPIHKAMARLSNCLVSNIQSAVFHRAPGEERFDRAFYDMVAVFENISGKRILRVTVVDQKDEEIAEFSTVPFQKRTFLVGIRPKQKEFEELTKSVKGAGKRPFYHTGTDKIVHFAETRTNFMTGQVKESKEDFRVIMVWKDEEKDPCWGVLTNQQSGSGEDILKAYMSQWPYLGETLQEDPVLVLSRDTQDQGAKEEEERKKDSGIFIDFIGALQEYCQKQFFPPAYARGDIDRLVASIYGTPGIYWGTENSLRVFLDVEKGSEYRKDLEYAVKKVNARHILDYSGRRLWLEI
ncbi:MAG: hypothetical protein KAR32_05125 [Candidatus Omnitrophica bacterium]|nr:hypothetical protein [Candidatus Omnitrophota bacterium]